MQHYFSNLLETLQTRGKEDAIGLLNIRNNALRNQLVSFLSEEYGSDNSLIGDPTFEATFSWKKSDKNMLDLSGNLLEEDLIHSMANPPDNLKSEYEFPKSRNPFTHQIKAWEILTQKEPQSIIVSSGTGSGKTECFLVPILNKLIQQTKEEGQLKGVRALFLYPLNALINSQKDRITAWTHSFGSNIRFCLYNGKTPEIEKEINKQTNEVLDRKDLRACPPPLLVTNATMLEYMLIRSEDNPILEQSKGKLEWIVLDEAHTYMGSQAAELALLLRRVLLAFDVKPENVRFIATSATIGDPNGEQGIAIKNFLADVAGISASQVHIVTGERELPSLPSFTLTNNDSPEKIEQIEKDQLISSQRFNTLCQSNIAVSIRQKFLESKKLALKLSEISRHINLSYSETLKWLDLLSTTKANTEECFLPLRIHIYQKPLSGMWACVDPNCPHKSKELTSENDWNYGAVWLSPKTKCTCGAPVYEVVICKTCRTPYLLAEDSSKDRKLLPVIHKKEDIDKIEENFDETEINQTTGRAENRVLIVPNYYGTKRNLDKVTLDTDEKNENSIEINCIDFNAEMKCPHCLETGGSNFDFYRYNNVSSTVMSSGLTPVLLEFSGKSQEDVNQSFNGRKLLTFNDSRQGTAKTAIRLQQSAEINTGRGLIYHCCLQKFIEQEPLIDENKLIQLKGILSEEELQKFLPVNFYTYQALIEKLTSQTATIDAIKNNFNDKYPQNFSQEDIAKIILIKEFGRRPYSQNNLETMGLVEVCYPKLKRINKLPDVAKQLNLTIKDWQDFLTICIDFVFRANGAISISQGLRRWLGMPYTQTKVIPYTEQDKKNFNRFFPSIRLYEKNKNNRIIRLLELALNLNTEDFTHADYISKILESAWNDLCQHLIIQREEDGYTLKTEEMAFKVLEKAWLCPVTGRFLNVTLKGITPYCTKNKVFSYQCELYTIPLYDKPFGILNNIDETLFIARNWLKTNEEVIKLRKHGLWTGLSDRVIEKYPYFTAEEHSGQLSSKSLENCVNKFKDGKINVLSCSTTMEMGIDIGGISVVGMNNVPPHPANYLQRTGRAGRRGETQSVAFTLCKDNPHELTSFYNSKWAFETDITAPKVALNSAVIVQRHINALLITQFLLTQKQAKDEEVYLSKSVKFFMPDENTQKSLADKFIVFCNKAKENDNIINQIKILCLNTLFNDNNSYVNSIKNCSNQLKEISAKWKSEHDQLLALKKSLATNFEQKTPAQKVVDIRLKRMEDEYLLKELISQGFLPAHGFPLNVVTFDTMNIDLYEKELLQKKLENYQDKENLFKRRELPSRPLSIALYEYIPGNSIAINGLVYQSKGITLNWHLPASQSEANEIQKIKCYWECKTCGGFDTSATASITHCTFCGEKLSSKHEYLEPAGFATAFYSSPTNNLQVLDHNDASVKTRAVVSENWINLGSPVNCRIRMSNKGKVFYYSKGKYGLGYSVCLACGHVESVMVQNEIPSAMQKHKKLRGGKNFSNEKETIYCYSKSNEWKIKQPLYLACDTQTDVFEIQFKNNDGQWVNNEDLIEPIAIALQIEIAAYLGIQNEELSYSIAQRNIEHGEKATSIYIYDVNAAGYSSSIGDIIIPVLKNVRERLLCKNGQCDTICPKCLLNYSSRENTTLNRHNGLEILTENWINMLELPQELKLFGESSSYEIQSIEDAMYFYSMHNTSLIPCIFIGFNDKWDLSSIDLYKLIDTLSMQEKQILLYISEETFSKYNKDIKFILQSLLLRTNIKILIGKLENIIIQNKLIACFCDTKYMIKRAWAMIGDDTNNKQVIYGEYNQKLLASKELERNDLIPSDNNSCMVKYDSQLFNIKLKTFGSVFWKQLFNEHKELAQLLEQDEIIKINYSDKYLSSPLVTALLYHTIEALLVKGKINKNITISLCYSSEISPNMYTCRIWDDWQILEDKTLCLKELFSKLGNIEITSKDKRELAHFRKMELIFNSGKKYSLYLDQGFGFIQVKRTEYDKYFDFTLPFKEQAQTIKKLNPDIQCTEFGTIVSIQHN